MDRDLADPFALAEEAQYALAGREPDIVDVEGEDLADAGAGVERDEGQRLVPGRRQPSTARR